MFEFTKRNLLRADQLSEFCRCVGAICGAGVPLAAAMEILQKGSGQKKIRKIYEELQEWMEQGSSFSNALERNGMFPELLINMFRAAEAGGSLEETAYRMAVYYRKEHQTKNQIRTAMLYPKLLCVVSLCVILTVFVVVMPTVEPLFQGVELPLLTRILMAFSDFLMESWYLCVLVLIGLYLCGRMMIKRTAIQVLLDRIKLSVPFAGKQYCMICTARFARSESDLYSSGLSMVEGLAIAARTIGNKYLELQFEAVIEMVQGGTSFSRAIESVKGFDPKFAPIVFVGEETGRMDEMLESIAGSYEYDAEAALKRLIAMMEPMMIIVMGLVIGTILLGVMMPMWSMYEYMI